MKKHKEKHKKYEDQEEAKPLAKEKQHKKQEELREKAREKKEKKVLNQTPKKKRERVIFYGVLIGLITSMIYFVFKREIFSSALILIGIPVIFYLYFHFRTQLKKSERVRKMEDVFPDFLQLMSSNLRAGITIDRSMLLSARPEFSPLDKEINQAGRDIATGKNIEASLRDMSKRINSEKIHKTILLIISGIRAGGNLATLLEETSVNMRERGFVEKRAASNVLMYVIFIFLAVSIGAPLLFSLSSLLVGTLTNILSGLPEVDASLNMPFTLSSVSISVTFIKYFSLAFIIVTDILAALTLGLVSKGEEKEGIKYIIPLLIISISVFFIVRFALEGVMAGLFG